MLTPVRDFVAGVEFCPEKPESAHGLQEILRVEKTLGGPFIPPHGFVFLSTHAVAFGESKPSGDQAHTLRNKWPAEASQNNRRNPRSPEIPRLRLVEFSRIVLPPFMAVSDAFASPPVPGF